MIDTILYSFAKETDLKKLFRECGYGIAYEARYFLYWVDYEPFSIANAMYIADRRKTNTRALILECRPRTYVDRLIAELLSKIFDRFPENLKPAFTGKDKLSGWYKINEIVTIKGTTDECIFPPVIYLFRIDNTFLMPLLGECWIDIKTGTLYRVILQGDLWPSSKQCKNEIKAFLDNLERIRIARQCYSLFMAFRKILQPRVIRIYCFHLVYPHIDQYVPWFVEINKLTDFYTYARIARIAKRHGLLSGKGYDFDAIPRRILEIFDENFGSVVLNIFGLGKYSRYIKHIINRDEVSPMDLANEAKVSGRMARIVLNVLSNSGLLQKVERRQFLTKPIFEQKKKLRKLLELCIREKWPIDWGFMLAWIDKKIADTKIRDLGTTKLVGVWFEPYIVLDMENKTLSCIAQKGILDVLKATRDEMWRAEDMKILQLVLLREKLKSLGIPEIIRGYLEYRILAECRLRGIPYRC